MKSKTITSKELEELIKKDTIKEHMKLIKWLYDNHLDVLREYESTKGNARIMFLKTPKVGER